jgi:hypothetical protein
VRTWQFQLLKSDLFGAMCEGAKVALQAAAALIVNTQALAQHHATVVKLPLFVTQLSLTAESRNTKYVCMLFGHGGMCPCLDTQTSTMT